MPKKPVCFVIMGFGEKQDPDTGRMLNLDSTFEFIIEPAVTKAGFECIRADKIRHSGIIDTPMYQMLMNADLVVADISTANANAIYELGVRHALRPRSTIVIKEAGGKRYFDLSHLATISYNHLGAEIGAGEAKRKSGELRALINEIERAPKDDSPVYVYLPGLEKPSIRKLGGRRGALAPAEAPAGPSLLELKDRADSAMAVEDFVKAQEHLEVLVNRGFEDPQIVQKLALATYKSKKPNPSVALAKGRKIIERLNPMSSTDPETLGIAGAIRKRQWQGSQDPTALDDAIALYGRGWSVREDYYTGENYANCLEMRSESTDNKEQVAMDRMTALRVRKQLVDYLVPLVTKSATRKRDDYKWMLATLSNTQLALGDQANAAENEGAFRSTKPVGWEVETFEATKKDMAAQAKKYQALRKKMGL